MPGSGGGHDQVTAGIMNVRLDHAFRLATTQFVPVRHFTMSLEENARSRQNDCIEFCVKMKMFYMVSLQKIRVLKDLSHLMFRAAVEIIIPRSIYLVLEIYSLLYVMLVVLKKETADSVLLELLSLIWTLLKTEV